MNQVKTLTIGNVTLPNRYILAPMAGISNLPFRLLCRKMGAGLVCMEMVSAKAILYHNQKTMDMLRVNEDEHPISLQLFGSDSDIIGDIVKEIEPLPFDIIDLNMGCPAPKIVKNGDGAALMRNIKLAGSIIERAVANTKKPVTVKMRMGFDESAINAVELARVAEASGAAAITVHGRTREQYYSGKANWDIIGEVKAAVSVPVIANGDIRTPEDVLQCRERSDCDGFMIARGAQGNPWIFRDLVEYEKTGVIPPRPSLSEVIDKIKEHAALLIAHKGEYIGMQEMRKHTGWYLSGCRGSVEIRRALNSIKTYEELEVLLAGIS